MVANRKFDHHVVGGSVDGSNILICSCGMGYDATQPDAKCPDSNLNARQIKDKLEDERLWRHRMLDQYDREREHWREEKAIMASWSNDERRALLAAGRFVRFDSEITGMATQQLIAEIAAINRVIDAIDEPEYDYAE